MLFNGKHDGALLGTSAYVDQYNKKTILVTGDGIISSIDNTKFKTDKKESLRKLDQTEANLIRLEDVIKEVKRQIISLQRQAGKAKRYKELKKEMKSLDLYLSSKQLNILKFLYNFLNIF